ncbi:serine/threonine-protein kinase pakA isoform X1 [Condylostylus longicornis]|uniref:serine/threonine-protein kinase pakA isoform X1 n=1 Tax=Condylostylus longicornis TaxID=2530218 RepID=UPI00244DC643|nr:serine/threonine-protein kinase pakA isoform X1 [Condylostylus longicornis]
MPLYTDSSGLYWAPIATSTSRDSYSSYLPGAYTSYTRPLTYSLPSTSTSSLRSNYASSSRYRPNLSTISETPYTSRGLTSLTRINSPKVSSTDITSTYHSTYTPARPININTADIDVSEERFKKSNTSKYRNYNLSTPITTSITENINESKTDNLVDESKTDINNNNRDVKEQNDDNKVTNNNENDYNSNFINRSTIKRNRTVVRLSISRPRKSQNTTINSSSSASPKKKKIVNDSTNNDTANTTNLNHSNVSDTDNSVSWRQKVGEDLLKPIKNMKKTPGDLIREKHIIPISDQENKTEAQINDDQDIEVPENLKPKEGEPTDLIVEVDNVTHTAKRRLSIPRCPDFQDFCEDISSDKLDDDLNAGELRRRASLIQEQEIELLNQLQKSASGSVQLIHLERVESTPDLVPSTKRKSKKKRIRHKITATVNVDNPSQLLRIDEKLPLESSNKDQSQSPETGKKSPKIIYNVDAIEENQTVETIVKLPKKKKKAADKKLETIENMNALEDSPKTAKITKNQAPLNAKNGKVENMEECLVDKPKQKKTTDVSIKPSNGTQSEISAPKTPLKTADASPGSPKTPKSAPLSPFKKPKALELKKSATSVDNSEKDLTAAKKDIKKPSTPDYFKFDEESISEAQKLMSPSSASKATTPKSAPQNKTSELNKGSDEVKLRNKAKSGKKVEKSDSGEDFWNSVGSRETIYFDKRKKSLIEDLWAKRETLLENEQIKDVKNIDTIKEKVNIQKHEELKEATNYIEPSGQAENRRARSNESALCDKSKGIFKQDSQEKAPTNDASTKNSKEVNDNKLKKATDASSTPITQTKAKEKSNIQKTQQLQESNELPKKSSGLDAKSPEIKNKVDQNKKETPTLDVAASDINKATNISSPGTPKSPGLNKITTNKKIGENNLNKQIDKLSKVQSDKVNDAKSSAFNEQGKENKIASKSTITSNATETNAKSNLLNKSEIDKNRKEFEIGSSIQLSTQESITSPESTLNKEKTPITSKKSTSQLDDNQKLATENVPKQSSNDNLINKENKSLEKENNSLSTISKNLTTSDQKKLNDKDKIKTNKITTTTKTASNDDVIEAGKNSTVNSDVKNDNKIAKINSEISSDAKNKNKPETTATTKTKTCDDKITTKNIKSATATATPTDNVAVASATTLKLANNNISDDKSIDNGASNQNKKNLKSDSSNSNNTELKNTTKTLEKPVVGERESLQLSFKKVLNKNKEAQLDENKKSGNLQKFDTIQNLNDFLFDVDAEVKDTSQKSKSDTSNSYNSNSGSDSDSMKRKDKKQKEKAAAPEPQPFNRNRIKVEHAKKLFVKDEAANKYMLIATPRPLWKPEKFTNYNSDSSDDSDDETTDTEDDSECETTSSEDDSGEENELNRSENNYLIRMSTCSNDSGFVGGTAPTNPKKMLETSYTYAQFQKTGRITAPATNIPRFKKYAVEDFHFLAVLGKGSFGKVLLAELRNSDYYYAVKCLKKDVVLEDDDVECTLIERKVLALGTKHPYLCHLFCTFQTESHLFFVMEYLNGGDLMFHIQQNGRFSEPRARFYAAEIVSGLKFLHKKGIVYRDLKLDNVLLDFEGHVRIADFGMCKLQIYLDKTADSFCGTPDYMAPEIIKGDNYNQNVDWWSFGVLLYEMLIGQSPFSGCDEEYLFWSICNEIPMYPMCLSQEATNLLKALLEKDSTKRIGSQYSPQGDILVHPFFAPIDWELLEKRQIEPPFKPQVKHPLDTKYFDKTFTRERVRLTPIDKEILHSMDQAQFQGFSYTNPNATLD